LLGLHDNFVGQGQAQGAATIASLDQNHAVALLVEPDLGAGI
jgi:hypothetical protein